MCEGSKDQGIQPKLNFAAGYSDHLTIYKAYKTWKEHKAKGSAAEKNFLRTNSLSRTALISIDDTKKDYIKNLITMGWLRKEDKQLLDTSHLNKNVNNEQIIKAVLCAGLYPNVYMLSEQSANNKQPLYTNGKDTAVVHMGSINYHLQSVKNVLLV